jgi:hypothetical protein
VKENTTVTRKEAVNLIDPTAKLNTWSSPKDGVGYWVKGNGWETKVTYSEDRAWEIAILEVTK